MAGKNDVISTGVDSFIRLLRDSKKIELSEAAVKLGLSKDMLEEWAYVLEEQGLVKIDYKLTKMYLIWIAKSKIELADKAAEIKDRKSSMERETETQLERVIALGKQLDSLRKEFGRVSEAFEIKMGGVKRRLEELNEVKRAKEDIAFRMNKLSQEHDEKLKQMDLALKKLEARRTNLLESHSQIMGKLGEVDSRITELVKIKKSAESNIGSFTKQIEKAEGDANTAIKKLQKAQEELKAEKAKMQEVSTAIDTELKKNEAAQKKLFKELESVKSEVTQMEKKAAEIKAEADKKAKDLNAQEAALKKKSGAALAAFDAEAKKLDELTKDFEERIKTREAFYKELDKLAETKNALLDELKELKKDLDELRVSKGKYATVDDILAKLEEVNKKLNETEKKRLDYAKKQADHSASLSNIWNKKK